MHFHTYWNYDEHGVDVRTSAVLPSPLQLRDGDYEMAITELYFTSSFVNIPMDSRIRFSDLEDEWIVEMPIGRYADVADITTNLRKLVKFTGIDKDNLGITKVKNENKIKWDLGQGISVKPSKELAPFLGLIVDQELKGGETGKTYYSTPQIPERARYMFLMSDLVSSGDHCYRGMFLPIVAVTPINYDAQTCVRIFEKPMYQKIKTKWLEKLEIRLCDELGRNLRMVEGIVYAHIHIKRVGM